MFSFFYAVSTDSSVKSTAEPSELIISSDSDEEERPLKRIRFTESMPQHEVILSSDSDEAEALDHSAYIADSMSSPSANIVQESKSILIL